MRRPHAAVRAQMRAPTPPASPSPSPRPQRYWFSANLYWFARLAIGQLVPRTWDVRVACKVGHVVMHVADAGASELDLIRVRVRVRVRVRIRVRVRVSLTVMMAVATLLATTY